MARPDGNILEIKQGSTFRRKLTWKQKDDAGQWVAVDISNCTLRLQIRSRVDADSVLFEFSTTNGRITLTDAANGVFTILATAAETAAMTWAEGKFDLDITFPNADVTTLWEGDAILKKEVTR